VTTIGSVTSLAAHVRTRPAAIRSAPRAAPAIQDAQWDSDRRDAGERRQLGVAMPSALERRRDLRRRGDRFEPLQLPRPQSSAALADRYAAVRAYLLPAPLPGTFVDLHV
jgi:hypothetical protein